MRSVKWDGPALFALTLLLPGMAPAAEHLPYPSPWQGLDMISLAMPADTQPDTATAQRSDSEEVNGIGAALALDQLESYRGGTEVNRTTNTTLTDGLMQDTTAINVATGKNAISDGAFAHASGLPIVIQNSGANVLIQNSTIINVQFR